MNIYIKTFNRPFYLDRCISSIKFNIKEYENIIILDDGTLTKYKEKIKKLHPDVHIVSSNADDNKYELLKQMRFEDIKKKYIDPGTFWVQNIEKDPNDYILVLEDDTWFIDMLNIFKIEEIMKNNKCLFVKLFWGEDKYSCEKDVYKKEIIFDTQTIDFFSVIINNIDDIWKIWIQCMAIYQTSYYLNSYKDIKDGVNDENYQLNKIYQFLIQAKEKYTFAKTNRRYVYQGWAITGRSDPKYYNLGLIQHIFLDCLNEAWYEDKFDVTEGYPFDFNIEYLLGHFKQSINEEQINLWIKWRQGLLGEGYKLYYND